MFVASEFIPYVFQVLALMLEMHAEGTVSPPYLALFPHLLLPVLWSRDGNIPPLVRLLQAYISRGVRQIETDKLASLYHRSFYKRSNYWFLIWLLSYCLFFYISLLHIYLFAPCRQTSCHPFSVTGWLPYIRLRCDVVLEEGEYYQNCLCATVLSTITLVHNDMNSSYRSVDWYGLWSFLV